MGVFARADRVQLVNSARTGSVVDQLDDTHVVVAWDDTSVSSLASSALIAYVPPPPPASYKGFGPGAWPSSSWRPYADSSPFNQLAAGQAVHENSAAIVSRVLSWGIGNLINGAGTSDYGHPTYYSKASDPVFTLSPTGYSPDVNGIKIPIPDATLPAGGSDHHMTIIAPDGWENDLWNVTAKPKGGGTLVFSTGGRTRIDGNGLLSNAVAARYGNLAGIIRAQELIEGKINHALFIVVKGCSSSTSFGHGAKTDGSSKSAFVYPAAAGASAVSDANAPVCGTRFQLAMTDAQINALAVPVWKKTILTALAHYGGYVGDTGGAGWGLQFESDATYTSYGQASPLAAFAQANKLAPFAGGYTFPVAAGVDWAQYLRVLVPPAP
jgi:hypothetical protein